MFCFEDGKRYADTFLSMIRRRLDSYYLDGNVRNTLDDDRFIFNDRSKAIARPIDYEDTKGYSRLRKVDRSDGIICVSKDDFLPHHAPS